MVSFQGKYKRLRISRYTWDHIPDTCARYCSASGSWVQFLNDWLPRFYYRHLALYFIHKLPHSPMTKMFWESPSRLKMYSSLAGDLKGLLSAYSTKNKVKGEKGGFRAVLDNWCNWTSAAPFLSILYNNPSFRTYRLSKKKPHHPLRVEYSNLV